MPITSINANLQGIVLILLGATVIVISGLYLMSREARAKRFETTTAHAAAEQPSAVPVTRVLADEADEGVGPKV